MQCSVYGILYIYLYNKFLLYMELYILLYRNEHKIDLKANFC